MKKTITLIIRRAYDLHVHIGPEIIPRKYTTSSLVVNQEGKVAGMALKNHFYPTTPFINEVGASRLRLIGSVVLNNFVGGLNPDAIYSASTLASRPFIVWFPTVSAQKFLDESEWEIAPEWVKKTGFRSRKAKSIKGIRVTDTSGKLTVNCKKVLEAIKQTGAILATGHISWPESEVLVAYANKIGIQKMIITHPIYQRIAMPIVMQKKLAAWGAKIELCWSMWKIDEIPIAAIAAEIKAVGAINCILSSDSGQAYSPAPNIALYEFCKALIAEGITLTELRVMLITNPKKLLERR